MKKLIAIYSTYRTNEHEIVVKEGCYSHTVLIGCLQDCKIIAKAFVDCGYEFSSDSEWNLEKSS